MLLLAFATVLLVAVPVSCLANRTILSTAVLFLVAGVALGPQGVGAVDVSASSPVFATLTELALFTVLFTDGMRVGWADLRSAWRLPGRALGWGLPLTLLVTALPAKLVVGLAWPQALLVGAIMAPTHPAFERPEATPAWHGLRDRLRTRRSQIEPDAAATAGGEG